MEAGGGFAMLTRRKAHAQLTEAQRLIHAGELETEWEADASMALRAGGHGADGALRIYDDHGRLRGGTYEQMAEAAAQHYLAELLAGKDVILTAHQNAECRDLGRRVQEQLRKWGKIDPSRIRINGPTDWTYNQNHHPGLPQPRTSPTEPSTRVPTTAGCSPSPPPPSATRGASPSAPATSCRISPTSC